MTKGFRDNPDDRIRLVAKGDCRTDNVRVAAKFALPETIAEDDDVPAVWRIFLGREGAANNDRCAEEAEVRFGDMNTVDLLRHSAREVETRTAEIIGSDILKDGDLGTPGIEVDR